MRQILLVDSAKIANSGLVNLLKSLKEKDYSFYLFLGRELVEFGDDGWNGKRTFFGPKAKGALRVLTFLALLPFLWTIFLLRLVSFKKKSGIESVILVGDNEKLIFSPLCSLLKLRPFWLELPEDDHSKKSALLIALLKRSARKATLITFTEAKRSLLKELGFSADNIKNASLGIRADSYEHQDDIFSNLAKNDNNYPRAKRFTIGAVVDLDTRNRMEDLFRALQICANMIPQLQVVIIGEGKERKNLNWLAKRMELDKIVWFVGQQENIRKWMENFSVYAIINESLSLSDMSTILEAMSCSLPVIGFKNEDLNEMVDNGSSGFLVKSGDADTLARRMVMLEQDYIMRSNFGKRARQKIEEKLNRARQIDSMDNIINYEKNIQKIGDREA